jgi:type I restriction enzyme R subunit
LLTEYCLRTCPQARFDEEELRHLWSVPETRKLWLHRRAEKGFGRDQLLEMQKVFDTEKSDINDVLAFVVYALTRQERAVHAS